MTTWTNAKISRKAHETFGGRRAIIYTIAGISGDTGGTLTVPFSNIETAMVGVYTASAGVANTWYIDGNTVVVAYSDPSAAHTVKITVVQG